MADSATQYDVIVIGVGGMGSATVYELAKRGKKVLGLEQFDIPHTMGSSHGFTRIIRMAYFEHPDYIPLLRRAYELWHALERETGQTLLVTTGGLDAGLPESHVFKGSLYSCQVHGLPHEVLTGAEVNRRFPGYQLLPDMQAVFQPDAGFLLPEQCIIGFVQAAQALGAKVHGREPVLAWEPVGEGVQVRTARGTYTADRLVITAGAWAGKLLPQLATAAVPERQVLIWMQPHRPEWFTPRRFPVFILHAEEGIYYGFPVHGIPGFKLGYYHHLKEVVDPDGFDRNAVTEQDEAVLRAASARYFPAANGPTLSLKTCMFTNSPDEHFILDRHPDYPQVSVAAGFSGHGFKFCSVIGEIMADLATTDSSRHEIGWLRWGRLM
ncbi:MAG: N-methyl-L-tryptophan oxidase [Anaerolineae bacterium]|nr:N-methyl-L-tryptophan oxidase [Anaerolineae bacterium]